jgi:hypothetical protein
MQFVHRCLDRSVCGDTFVRFTWVRFACKCDIDNAKSNFEAARRAVHEKLKVYQCVLNVINAKIIGIEIVMRLLLFSTLLGRLQ